MAEEQTVFRHFVFNTDQMRIPEFISLWKNENIPAYLDFECYYCIRPYSE
jgi:hypothetical protein